MPVTENSDNEDYSGPDSWHGHHLIDATPMLRYMGHQREYYRAAVYNVHALTSYGPNAALLLELGPDLLPRPNQNLPQFAASQHSSPRNVLGATINSLILSSNFEQWSQAFALLHNIIYSLVLATGIYHLQVPSQALS